MPADPKLIDTTVDQILIEIHLQHLRWCYHYLINVLQDPDLPLLGNVWLSLT